MRGPRQWVNMDNDYQRSVSLRASRRAERNHQHQPSKGNTHPPIYIYIYRNKNVGKNWNCLGVDADALGGFFSPGRLPQDYPMKVIWKRGFIRLVLVGGILWMMLILIVLLFHIWSCQSSLAFFSGNLISDTKMLRLLSALIICGIIHNRWYKWIICEFIVSMLMNMPHQMVNFFLSKQMVSIILFFMLSANVNYPIVQYLAPYFNRTLEVIFLSLVSYFHYEDE